MRIGRSTLATLGLIAVLGPLSAASAWAAEAIDAAKAQKLTTDSSAARSLIEGGNAEELAWNWFIALNNPLTGGAPKAWEAYRPSSTVYLPDGRTPAPWGQTPAPPAAVIAQAQKDGLNTNLPFHNLDSDVQSDGLPLRDKFGQNVRYQILMNEDTFGYILSNGIYNINGQQAMAQAGKPTDFPWTSFELKTSWIWIGTDAKTYQQLNGKYYIVNAYYALADGSGKPNGLYKVGRAALSGMHIISKPVPQWFWVTFQNVYDAQYTQATNQLPIAPAVKAANQKYQSALKGAGSIFANYQLIGTQWQFVNQAGQPLLLANSQIESAFQGIVLHDLPRDRELFHHQRLFQHRETAERRHHLLHRAAAGRSAAGIQHAGLYLVAQARAVAALALNIERHRRRTGEHHERIVPAPHLFHRRYLLGPGDGQQQRLFSDL